MKDPDQELDEYLARIRKTISESENLVAQAELRMRETDRLLESQGLTREQVMNLRFTEAQRQAANEELRRRGLEPLEWEEEDARPDPWAASSASFHTPDSAGSDLAERQRKFGMMMKPFQI